MKQNSSANQLMDPLPPSNAKTLGDGPPVILIHGIAASLSDWEYLMPVLSEAGYCTYALDLLGHGQSAKPAEPGHYHFEAIFAHLAGWIDSLGLKQPPVFVGHSLGGFLSLYYALKYPEKCSRLCLLDPFYRPEQLSPFLRLVNRRPAVAAKALDLTPHWLFHKIMRLDIQSLSQINEHSRRQIAEDYKRASPLVVHITGSLPDLTGQIPQIKSPTLVIWGEKDLTLRPDLFPELVKMLPDARGQVIPKCGHQPHLCNSADVNRLVLDFLVDGQHSSR